MADMVLSSGSGYLISAAMTYLVAEQREIEIRSARSYSHKRAELETVPFMSVYTDETATGTAGIGPYLCKPEQYAVYFRPKRIDGYEEHTLQAPHDGKVKVYQGHILLRSDHCVLRLWVEVKRHFASNGNMYKHDYHVFTQRPRA